MIKNPDTQIHFIANNSMWASRLTSAVPRKGDELRFTEKGEDVFFKVERVIWVYDEPHCPYNRVNIGMKRC